MNKVVKKLVSFLFEEDTEVYAEDELEEVVFSKESKKDKEVINEESPIKKERISVENNMLNDPIKKEVEVNKTTVQQKRFQSIDLQDIQETTNHTSSRTEGIKREAIRKEYEFSPVISPMFGTKDEPVRKPSNQQPTILKSRPKKRSTSIGAIISPIYGADDIYEDEEIEKMEHVEFLSPDQEEQAVVEEKAIVEQAISLDDEESEFMKSIPLEDLLQDEDNSNEDTMQISLFGEDTPVREKEDTTDYTIKE